MFDTAFQKHFGWKARSEGVFVSSEYFDARYYGRTYLFFPFNDYKFVYSIAIDDFLKYLKYHYLIPDIDKGTFTEKDIESFVKNMYISSNLHVGIESGNEIMFKCKKYYLINSKYRDFIWKTFYG